MSALTLCDPETQEHAGRIRATAEAIAVALAMPAAERHALRLGAILHDVGKIGIADPILLKPGPLDEREWEVMRSHPLVGERILEGIHVVSPAIPIVRQHHERWDGGGYPDGLAGDDIPLGARIVAVCDAFDAMTSDRPYRAALPLEVACEELTRCAGTQFDPACSAPLVELAASIGEEPLEGHLIRHSN